MKQLTFQNIFTRGNIIVENEQYKQIHYPEMLIRYDSNFIEFKALPTLATFKEVEAYLRQYHLERGQNHLKFYLPANLKPTEELDSYFIQAGYDVGFLELYTVNPKDFPSLNVDLDITIQAVTKETLSVLQKLKYQSDLEFGREFADQKAALVKRQFDESKMQQVLAFYQGQPAGYVDLILTEETIEIDELTVIDSYQKKGIGSHLQRFVMDNYPEKTVILVADGEDTPRKMYQKQNYHYLGFQYEMLKE